MKKQLLPTLLFLSMLMSAGDLSISAQSVNFTYDECGNRTGREVIWPGVEPLHIDQLHTWAESTSLVITISPNPASGIFKVRIQNWKPDPEASLLVQNMHGMLVLELRQLEAEMMLDLRDAPDGMYLLTVLTGGEKYVRKLIKR